MNHQRARTTFVTNPIQSGSQTSKEKVISRPSKHIQINPNHKLKQFFLPSLKNNSKSKASLSGDFDNYSGHYKGSFYSYHNQNNKSNTLTKCSKFFETTLSILNSIEYKETVFNSQIVEQKRDEDKTINASFRSYTNRNEISFLFIIQSN